jgi:hypothetical protein
MAWSWHGMCESNTAALCKSMGKTQSKPLAAWHGKGTPWERHGNGMVCVNQPLLVFLVLPCNFRNSSLFTVTCKHSPSTGPVLCNDISTFRKPITYLQQILHQSITFLYRLICVFFSRFRALALVQWGMLQRTRRNTISRRSTRVQMTRRAFPL